MHELLEKYGLTDASGHIQKISETTWNGNTTVQIEFHPNRLDLEKLRKKIMQSARPGTPLHHVLDATRQELNRETLQEIVADQTGFQLGFFGQIAHSSQVNPNSAYIQWDEAGKQLLECVKKSLKRNPP
ncbi:hypothetical protein HY572_03815 [Candidatus Micrarchaeota archaeon]|nr:hypothetical protein [Candidatus Micrarchaeota archaeon]